MALVPLLAWWRHQIETFSALLALYEGNSPVTGEFPSQMTVTRSFDIFFDRRLNKRLNKHSRRWWFETPSRPLWSHCNEIIHRPRTYEGPALNALRSRQNGRHSPDGIFKCIFFNENCNILMKISLKFVPQCPINNIPALVNIMAFCRSGEKPLSQQMMG